MLRASSCRANGLPNHNDLDGGTFVFEAGGQRWGMDMGSGDYELKNYFSQNLKFRYGYYRKSTAGHNTLVRGPTTWTITRYDGPNHLGLC